MKDLRGGGSQRVCICVSERGVGVGVKGERGEGGEGSQRVCICVSQRGGGWGGEV